MDRRPDASSGPRLGAADAEVPRELTGYPWDPDGLAAGAVSSVRRGPHVDDVAPVLHGQPQLGRGPVRAQHPHAVLAARPVENLHAGTRVFATGRLSCSHGPAAVTLFTLSQLRPERLARGRVIGPQAPRLGRGKVTVEGPGQPGRVLGGTGPTAWMEDAGLSDHREPALFLALHRGRIGFSQRT